MPRLPSLVAVLTGLVCAGTAGAVTVGDLAGTTLNMTVNYNMKGRHGGNEFPMASQAVWRMSIAAGGKVSGTFTRNANTPRGPFTSSSALSGTIGKSQQAAGGGGHAVWLLEGNRLTMLRTFQSGGFKAEISFAGSGAGLTCSIRAPFAREQGAGNIQLSHISVGPVEILSASQTSSNCRVSR